MPFCNKCGAEIAAGAGFCAQCGSRNMGGIAASPQLAASPPARKTGMGLGAKIALGVGVVIAVIFLALFATGLFVASHIKKVRTADGRTVVETPFGTVGSGEPSDQVARQLGIAQYPGAQPEPSARVDMGAFHTDVLRFNTSDSPEQVIAYYARQFPGGVVRDREPGALSVVDGGLTLNIRAHSLNGRTELTIRQVRR